MECVELGREYLCGETGVELTPLNCAGSGGVEIATCEGERIAIPDFHDTGLWALILTGLVLKGILVELALVAPIIPPIGGRGESGTFHKFASSGRSSSVSSYSSSSSFAVFRLGCHEPLLDGTGLISGETACREAASGADSGDAKDNGVADGEGERERLWLLIALLANLEEVENFLVTLLGPTGMDSAWAGPRPKTLFLCPEPSWVTCLLSPTVRSRRGDVAISLFPPSIIGGIRLAEPLLQRP